MLASLKLNRQNQRWLNNFPRSSFESGNLSSNLSSVHHFTIKSVIKLKLISCLFLDLIMKYLELLIANEEFWTKQTEHSIYSGFRRKARVIKCKRFGRQKRAYGPRRSMRRPWKLGTRNATLLVLHDRTRCFAKKVLVKIAPYTFISHTMMSIVFGKGRSTNYIAWKPAR